MLPLIFDDMGIPPAERAAVTERIYQEQAALRNAYTATYGCEFAPLAAAAARTQATSSAPSSPSSVEGVDAQSDSDEQT